MKIKLPIAIFLLALSGCPGFAQKPARPDSSMVNFFLGEWKGEGTFANGRKISATVDFRLALDSTWLINEHRDIPPNTYKATDFWGTDPAAGQFVGYTFDNFNGHREWSSTGWAGGRIVLSGSSHTARYGTFYEHFIYERLDANLFRMTYENSRDSVTYHMGDTLRFTRVRP
jgi:hypothetical protein